FVWLRSRRLAGHSRFGAISDAHDVPSADVSDILRAFFLPRHSMRKSSAAKSLIAIRVCTARRQGFGQRFCDRTTWPRLDHANPLARRVAAAPGCRYDPLDECPAMPAATTMIIVKAISTARRFESMRFVVCCHARVS